MPSVKQDHQCIERRAVRALTDDGSRFFYSVSEYEDARRKARTLSNPRALSFHGVVWAEFVPQVHQLRTEWDKVGSGYVRICDRSLYDSQMQKLLGIA